MRKLWLIGFICWILFGSLAAETWKITSLDWQPYSGNDLANQGTAVDQLRKILAAEGIELVVEFYPWLRAQKLAAEEDYLGYFPAWPEEVKEGFVASHPIAWSSIGALTYAGSKIQWENTEKAFSNFKIGYVKTYTYPQAIENAIKQHPNQVVSAPDEIALVRMLANKRFDIALTDPNVMHYNAEKEGITGIETIHENLEKKELVIALNQTSANQERIKRLGMILSKHHTE